MCPRPQYTDLTYMGGTGSCGPMKISFGSVIKSWYSSLNNKFGANRTIDVPKISLYMFVLYGKYQILWTDIAIFKTNRPMANRSLFAKFEIRSYLRSDSIMITTNGRTDRHSSNIVEFRADQMTSKNLGSPINKSRYCTLQN